MVFNPSSVDRLVHVIIGCWLTGIFFVLSVSAYYFLKKRHKDFSNATMKIGICMAVFVLALQLMSADSSRRRLTTSLPNWQRWKGLSDRERNSIDPFRLGG